MSNYSIMSVKDMIDMAFGDPRVDVVNFKLIQTILYLLARQLRVLGRRVEVDVSHVLGPPRSSITVTEVKMKAAVPKKTKHTKLSESEITSSTDVMSEKRHSLKKTVKKGSIEQEHTKGVVDHGKGMADPRRGGTGGEKDKHSLQGIIEEHRERELRVIRQRVDSREEAEKFPTPMASLDSIEMQYEKLLIVERSSSEDARAIHDDRTSQVDQGSVKKTLQLSVVTQEQFQALAAKVLELQSRFGDISSANIPDNVELMQELRKGASLTDAMAALQLSARLEAAEKTLKRTLSLITDLASRTPGVQLPKTYEKNKPGTGEIYGTDKSKISPSDKKQPLSVQTPTDESNKTATFKTTRAPSDGFDLSLKDLEDKDMLTFGNLTDTFKKLQSEIIAEVKNMTKAIAEDANNALKMTKKLDVKLEATVQLAPRMRDLETLVADYADQINALDTGLSAQMTNHQENLNQMQQDLDIALENMNEALANAGGDTEAVGELNSKLISLQEDFDRTSTNQKELLEMQNTLHLDLQGLWHEIEKLREIKPDREEVTDALRDKAGLKALNGLVTQEHFDAIRGNFQKSVAAAYEKFNNQENVWQKAIDDVFREMSDKADWVQFNSLTDDINRKLDMLNRRIQAVQDILGEPIAAATTRKLFRDTACISCSSPAYMEQAKTDTIPQLPALPSTKKKLYEEKQAGDGDHYVCIPGRPVTHTLDARSEFCHRYCGGGSVGRPIMKRDPIEIVSTTLTATAIGTDGKTYMIEEYSQPCGPCNQPQLEPPQPLEADQAPECVGAMSVGTTPSDIVMKQESCLCGDKSNCISVTPTLPFDDDD